MNETPLPPQTLPAAAAESEPEPPPTIAAGPAPAGMPPPPIELLTATDVADVVRAAVRKGKESDMDAAKVVWRFWRWRRDPVVLDFGEVRTAEQIADAQSRVLGLTFAGRLMPVDGARLSAMIENRRRALHTLEQQRQLDDLAEMARRTDAPAKVRPR